MQKSSTDNVQGKAHTAHYEYKHHMIHLFDVNESFNGLEEDAHSQSEQKDSIEEGAQSLGPLPTKGEPLRRFFSF